MMPVEFIKPPVLLIHGMWGTDEAMLELKAEFEQQDYSVEALCLPMHKPKASYTNADKSALAQTSLEDYVNFIIAKVDSLKVPPILVGHSMGGLLAQLVAARVRISKLILISSAAPGGINSWSWSMMRTFGRNLFRFPLWKKVTEIGLANVQYGIANTQSLEVQRFIADNATYESGRVTFQIGLGGMFPGGFARVDAKRIQCPMLIIGGEKDCITPIKIQRAIAKKYGANAKLIELAEACHWTVGGSHLKAVSTEIFSWLSKPFMVESTQFSTLPPKVSGGN
ncbi:alpha/beta hydrolase [Shewanella sp. A25]|nr:alpha/beta hydrolase [Shewanella shenzhenensis]